MHYNLDINDRAFNAICNETKKVEIRVTTNPKKKDYSKLNMGDTITFINSRNEKQDCRIKEINWYKNEKELLMQEGTKNTLSSTNDYFEGIKSILRFDGYKDGIEKYGIYAIHLEKINSVHEMKLQLKYYNFMLNGTKRIELRLFDEKRQQIKLGDTIKFLKESDLNDSFNTRVTGLLRYDSFDALIKDFDISILCDETMTKDELIGVLKQFYTKEKQEQYGVLGIRIELI